MVQYHKTHMSGCAVDRPEGGHPRSPQGKFRWGRSPWAKGIQDIDAGAPKTPSPRSPGCEGWLRQGSPADGPVGGAAPMSRMTFDRGVPPHSLLPHNPPRRPPECLNQGVLFLPRVFSITERGYPAFYCFSPLANRRGRGHICPLISPKRAMASDVVLPSSDPRIWEKYRGAGFPKSQGGVHSGRLN